MTNSSMKWILVAALAVSGAACGTKDAADPLAPTSAQGRIRFVNVITDTTKGRVNAILEGLPFGVNLTYTQSTPATLPSPSTALYAPVYAGSRSLKLVRTADTTTTIGTFSATIAASVDHTVYAVGGTGATAVSFVQVADTNTAPAAGQVRLRAVNMSPTAGAVDIFVTAAGADLSTATPTFSNVPVQGKSGYVSIAAGTYTIRAVPAGTAAAARNAAVTITLAGQALGAGAGRTIVTADNNVGGAPLRAFLLTDL